MDPATAFQIACGAFQLTQTAIKTISAGYETYQNASHLSQHNERVERETGFLDRAISSVKDGLGTLHSLHGRLTQEQQRLQRVVDECIAVANEIQDVLDSMKVKGQKRKRDVPASVIRQTWHSRHIKNLQYRLENCEKLLKTELLLTLWSAAYLNCVNWH